MKLSIVCLIYMITLSHFITAQDTGTLMLVNQKLIGNCNNPYFTGFQIELDTLYDKIDSLVIFNQLPRIGSIHFKNRINIPTEFTMTERAGFPQIMFRFKSSYLTFDNLHIYEDHISFTIDDDPSIPVTESDVSIIKLAKNILSSVQSWHKEDDRNCVDDLANRSYSIYCALRIASLEIENKYNHRNAPLQELRHLISDEYPGRQWTHRLMEYNNLEETSYTDIIQMLNQIEHNFMRSLDKRKK